MNFFFFSLFRFYLFCIAFSSKDDQNFMQDSGREDDYRRDRDRGTQQAIERRRVILFHGRWKRDGVQENQKRKRLEHGVGI